MEEVLVGSVTVLVAPSWALQADRQSVMATTGRKLVSHRWLVVFLSFVVLAAAVSFLALVGPSGEASGA